MIMVFKFCLTWTVGTVIFMLYYIIFLHWTFKEIKKLFLITLFIGYILIIIWHVLYGLDFFFYGPKTIKIK